MDSAVAGFMQTFESDEPLGCYDEHREDRTPVGDLGRDMAEMHPILWSRIVERASRA